MDTVLKCINGVEKQNVYPMFTPEKYTKIKKPVNQIFTGLISFKKLTT